MASFESKPQSPRFLTYEDAREISVMYGTPAYVYNEREMRSQAANALNFPVNFGLKVRYAMKACPNANILRIFHSIGLHFDASSGYEVDRALLAGVPASSISLSAQELPGNFVNLLNAGIHFNACSLHQLEQFGKVFNSSFAKKECGVRFNPGVGSGGTGKTNVGGHAASFGVWHEHIPEVKRIAEEYGINIIRVHTHIGSGSDPLIWQQATHLSLAIVSQFPNVTTLNLGGGYKVGRTHLEPSTNLQEIGAPVKQLIGEYAEQTNRKLDLEIEPGTYLMANCGSLLCKVQDVCSTTKDFMELPTDEDSEGFRFLKLDAGMTELLRPSLYAAQHPISLIEKDTTSYNDCDNNPEEYVVVGHCCESGDLFSCEPGASESLRKVSFPRKMRIGDYVSIDGTGAYCSSMSTKNYNSFPEAPEMLIRCDGTIVCIRRKQSLEQIIQNEMALSRNMNRTE